MTHRLADLSLEDRKLVLLISRAERKFPGALFSLWKGLVFHPGQSFLGNAPRGFATFPADVADLMLEMQRAGWVRPTKFNPDHSRAAFIGVSDPTPSGSRKRPHAGDADSWEWECLIEPQVDLAELRRRADELWSSAEGATS